MFASLKSEILVNWTIVISCSSLLNFKKEILSKLSTCFNLIFDPVANKWFLNTKVMKCWVKVLLDSRGESFVFFWKNAISSFSSNWYVKFIYVSAHNSAIWNNTQLTHFLSKFLAALENNRCRRHRRLRKLWSCYLCRLQPLFPQSCTSVTVILGGTLYSTKVLWAQFCTPRTL